MLETYPRDELFQIDEDTLYRFRAEHPAARGAPAGARAGAARPLRPLRLGAGLCAARALQRRRCARRSANISPRSSRATSAPTIRTSTMRRWPACISSSAARRPDAGSRSRDAGETGRRDRAHLDRRVCRGAGRGPRAGQGRARCWRAIATRSPTATATPIRRRVAVEDIRDHRGADAGAAARRRFLSRVPRTSKPCVGLKVWSHGRPIPLSERVPVLENMGFRVVDERTFQVGGDGAGRRLAARHGAGARRRRRRPISTS